MWADSSVSSSHALFPQTRPQAKSSTSNTLATGAECYGRSPARNSETLGSAAATSPKLDSRCLLVLRASGFVQMAPRASNSKAFVVKQVLNDAHRLDVFPAVEAMAIPPSGLFTGCSVGNSVSQ